MKPLEMIIYGKQNVKSKQNRVWMISRPNNFTTKSYTVDNRILQVYMYDNRQHNLLDLQIRKSAAERCIMYAAKLISPVIESSFAAGFDW